MAAPNPVNTFLLEAEDLLTQIEEVTLELNPAAPDGEAINRLFRAFHTIKGSGSMFGFDAVASFTHHVETALDQVREGRLGLSRELLALVLGAKDHIQALFQASQSGAPTPIAAGEKLIVELGRLGNPTPAVATTPLPVAPAPAPVTATQEYRIRFRPERGILAAGTNPLALLQELRGLGVCQITANADAVPALEELQPDQCYLAWEILLTTDRGLNAIKDVFIFVEDGSELTITAQPQSVSAKSIEPEPSPLPEPTAAPQTFAPARSITPAPSRAASEVPATARASATRDATVRVPSEKLDRLVNLVGELVMNQSRLTQVAGRCNLPDLAVPVEEIERLVSELRDNVLGIRMMPIGTTFSRFKRLVHDLSRELGKEIELVTEGAETELDKTVIDQLGDPLVHLIRNSIDHGIECGDARAAAGKPRQGTIRLAATHVGSNVIVTISDDGKGLDTTALRAKAIEKQLIAPDAVLSEKETFNLIFLPGFSTAKQITSVSGRGVGMDVVKRQIDGLRGSIAIRSELGQGTTIALTLPLTLAIIDGLLVSLGDDQFIIPMSLVLENVDLSRADRGRNNGRNVVAVRGELIPYLRLRDLFGSASPELDVEKVVIVRHEDQRVGLVVDRVLGSHQTVIQSLGKFYRNITSVSGATIMGDGRVALILDLAGLLRAAAAATPSSHSSVHPQIENH
nr:signal transduction histidine kinase CheA [uncultured bacterium]